MDKSVDKPTIPPIRAQSDAKCLTQQVEDLVADYAAGRTAPLFGHGIVIVTAPIGLDGRPLRLFDQIERVSIDCSAAGEPGTPPPPGGDPAAARGVLTMGPQCSIEGAFPREGVPEK